MSVTVKVIEDSISPDGQRLTSLEIVTHRFVLAEWNTHRKFSRNSASSRAIPLETMLARVWEDPAWPLVWPCEQPGMSGGAELSAEDRGLAWELFQDVHLDTYNRITEYLAMIAAKYPDDPKAHRLHKSLVNRLIEPFMFHTMLISSTEFENFYRQRCSPTAMPEFRIVAEMVRDTIGRSDPRELAWGEWHTPYIGINDEDQALSIEDRIKVSVGRCARTSYLTHDGVRDPQKDIDLYEGTLAKYGHWSPLEHVAICLPTQPSIDESILFIRAGAPRHRGNFDPPWFQLRQFVEASNGTLEGIAHLLAER